MTYLARWTAWRLLLAIVVAPVLVTATYLAVLGQDRFVSTSTVALRASGSSASAMPGAALLLAGLTTPDREDTLLLKSFVQSLGLLQQLDQDLGLRKHYASPERDVFLRLSRDASLEEFLEYYRDRVTARLDELSLALSIDVQAFDPAFAQKVNRALLARMEEWVNEYSRKMASERLAFADAELARASDQLRQARAALLAFQQKNRVLSASAEAEATTARIVGLRAEISKAEAELRDLQTFLNDDAPQLRSARLRVGALRGQLAAERDSAVSSGRGDARLNALAAENQALDLQAQIALDTYRVALAAVENARIDTQRKFKTMITVEPPTLAETATLPRRTYATATVGAVALLVFAVVRLTLAAIREHQD